MKIIPHILSLARLDELFQKIQRLRVGVIGDIALDAYWQVDMTRARLSRETPLYPRPVVCETYAPGAGGNVAQNLVALGAQVVVFSVFGEDTWSGRLLAELQRREIDTTFVLHSAARRTVAYIKPILMGYNSQQEDARLDFENTSELSAELETQLVEALEGQIAEFDAVLVADQFEVCGLLTTGVRSRLVEIAAVHPETLFLVDSRSRIRSFCHMVMKLNWLGAVGALAPGRDPRQVSWAEIVAVGQAFAQESQRPVYITLSEIGVLVSTAQGCEQIAAAPVRPPLDPVGAGDAFLAALAVSLSSGATASEAGAFANLAAAVTVEKLNQTGAATPDEIRARLALADQATPRQVVP